MTWDEFKDLLVGLPAECALGRIAQIRLEDDKEKLKNFTPQQRKIRSDWILRKSKAVSPATAEQAIEGFKNIFIKMAGGG